MVDVKKTRKKPDAELAAIGAIQRVLEPLTRDARGRVVSYVSDRQAHEALADIATEAAAQVGKDKLHVTTDTQARLIP